MKLQRNIWVFLMVGLFVSVQSVYADQCDVLFKKAKGLFGSAGEAGNQKNYDRAIELYEEAAKYYEKLANMKNCRCPIIHRNAPGNAKISRENAAKWRKAVKEYETELKFVEQYNRANKKYKEGDTHARNRQWDKAIAAFEEAGRMWDSVGAATQSETGKKALKSAKLARDSANLARSYQNK
jgi:tetratricopeptide (TPR) repeat protein